MFIYLPHARAIQLHLIMRILNCELSIFNIWNTYYPVRFLAGGFKSIRRMSPPRPQDWTVLGLGLGSFLAICVTVSFLDTPLRDLKKQYWIASLIYNLISYSAIFLPGFLILKYVAKTQFLETGPKLLSPAIRLCFYGNNEETIDDSITGKIDPDYNLSCKSIVCMVHVIWPERWNWCWMSNFCFCYLF